MRHLSAISRPFLTLFVLASTAFAADEPKRIEPTVANQNILKKVEPTIPPLAKAAGIGGTVSMDVTISVEGKVKSYTVLSGHPLLVQSCIDAVKQWEYKPFIQDGQAKSVVTSVQCLYASPNYTKSEEKALRDYYPAFKACYDFVRARNYLDAERKCTETVALSDELPTNRVLERRSARTFLAHSILGGGKPKDAIPLYKAVLEIDKGREGDASDADVASEHANLAHAYFLIGELDQADPLFDRAVTIFEAAIVALPSMKENYTDRLKRTLLEYAKLKNARGEMESARALERKALALHEN